MNCLFDGTLTWGGPKFFFHTTPQTYWAGICWKKNCKSPPSYLKLAAPQLGYNLKKTCCIKYLILGTPLGWGSKFFFQHHPLDLNGQYLLEKNCKSPSSYLKLHGPQLGYDSNLSLGVSICIYFVSIESLNLENRENLKIFIISLQCVLISIEK